MLFWSDLIQVPEQDRSLQYGIVADDSILCHIRLLDVQFEDGTSEEVYACTFDDSQEAVGGMAYKINLPGAFVNENRKCIVNGACYVDIPGGQVLDDDISEPTIEFPEATVMSVKDKSKSDSERSRKLLTTGSNPVLVVRVQASDSSCDPTSEELAGSVFGIGNQALSHSMVSQYYSCSQEQFTVHPIDGNNVVNGVLDVTISEKAWGTNIFSITNTMFQAASAAVGSSLSETPRHIMYCVPYGTTYSGSKNWVAFAHVGGYNSWYNDNWCNMLSAQVSALNSLCLSSTKASVCLTTLYFLIFQMHEIGHNLGMQHSNENGQSYGDQTGLMGFRSVSKDTGAFKINAGVGVSFVSSLLSASSCSYAQVNGPLMCFNAFKHYKFGWYASQTVTVDPNNGAWTGELAAFTDAKNAESYQAVIINVGDIYMQLNRAEGMNSGTHEKQNQVVLIEGTDANVESDCIGGLASAGDKKYLSGNIIVELCELKFNSGPADFARISIYMSNQSSGCNGPSPTPAPAPQPTESQRNSAIAVTGFTLIDTDLNQKQDWDYCTYNSCSKNLSIRAETSEGVRSVQMILSGESSHTQTENTEPFMLYGDKGWQKLFPGDFKSGSYTIRATAYSEYHLLGQPSAEQEFSFYLK